MKDEEHLEQRALFEWAAHMAKTNPAYGLLLAIPNGGHRHISVATKLKREGVRSGVPDIFLACPRKAMGGLWIELKKPKGGRVSPEQKDWISRLVWAGYQAEVCHGWEAAKQVIEKYLS